MLGVLGLHRYKKPKASLPAGGGRSSSASSTETDAPTAGGNRPAIPPAAKLNNKTVKK